MIYDGASKGYCWGVIRNPPDMNEVAEVWLRIYVLVGVR